MKIRLMILGTFLLSLFHYSCNDVINSVGNSMRPGEDDIHVQTDSFEIKVSTVIVDSIYAKSTMASLGEMHDPLYGNLKSDYICQFYCEEGFQFSRKPIDGKIDSVQFFVYYYNDYISGWVGDSLATLEAQIYSINKPLERHYYSNFDPSIYSDMQTSLGRRSYTARDMNVSNAVWYAKSDGAYTYIPRVQIEMPVEFGQKIYDETINNPGTFKNQQSFNEFLPGIYVTTTYGSGSILNIYDTRFVIHYSYEATTKDSQGNDSTYVSTFGEVFMPTKEVIQLNRFENSGLNQLLNPEDEFVYLKSPAGVFTKLTIPTTEMLSIVEGRTINSIPYSFNIRPQEEWDYALSYPPELLLIPKDSMEIFFQESRAIDSYTSFYAHEGGGYPYGYSSYGTYYPYRYNFRNISTVIQEHIKNTPDKDLELLLIPVNANSTYSSSTSYRYVPGSSTTNYFYPTAAKIRKNELTKIKVTSSTFVD